MAFKRRGNDRGVIYPLIPSGKFLKDDGSWAVVTSESTIEDAPVINHNGSAISSNWAYRHSKNEYTEKHVTAAQIASFHDIATAGEGILINGQQISVNFSAVAAKVHVHTIDDEPLDGHTTIPISSNWAADHEANRRASKHITSEQLSALHAPVTITGTGLNLAGQMLSIDYGAVAAAHTHEQYLTDAPGNGSFYARRNGSWQTFSLTGGSWGTITGTLSDQTDLQNALNAKISMPVLTDHAGETLVVNSGETAFEFASVCLLNEQGLIDSELLPGSVVGALVYRGVFNPVSGAPIPASQGYYYISSGIGTISGTEFSTGDWLVYRDSSTWDRIANSEVSYYWDNILEKPASFMPTIHGNERHTDEYITIDALTEYATNGDLMIDAPLDGLQYVRQLGEWASIDIPYVSDMALDGRDDIAISANWAYDHENDLTKHMPDAPENMNYYARRNGAWASFEIQPIIDLSNYIQKTNLTDNVYYVLKNDEWTAMPTSSGGEAGLPSQTGNNGKFLRTDGTVASWETVPAQKELIYSIEGEIYKTVFMYYRVPANATLISATATLLNRPTGDNVTVDVRKNGVESTNSVFTGDTPITITPSTSATNGVYIASGSIEHSSLTTNDIIYVMVTNVGSTFKGTDLLVQLIVG